MSASVQHDQSTPAEPDSQQRPVAAVTATQVPVNKLYAAVEQYLVEGGDVQPRTYQEKYDERVDTHMSALSKHYKDLQQQLEKTLPLKTQQILSKTRSLRAQLSNRQQLILSQSETAIDIPSDRKQTVESVDVTLQSMNLAASIDTAKLTQIREKLAVLQDARAKRLQLQHQLETFKAQKTPAQAGQTQAAELRDLQTFVEANARLDRQYEKQKKDYESHREILKRRQLYGKSEIRESFLAKSQISAVSSQKTHSEAPTQPGELDGREQTAVLAVFGVVLMLVLYLVLN